MTVAAHPPWTPSDAVGAALHVLRMSGTFYCSSDLRGPWGLRLPETPGCLWFHVVTSGTATIVVGDEVVTLSPSDVVLLPRGEGHEMRSTDPPPRSPAPNVLTLPHTWYGERYATITYGGDGAPTTMICGAVRLEHPMAERLVALMPDIVHVPVSPLTARLHDTLRLIALEVEETRPGGEAVITRLADVLVVQMLRAWLSHDPSARTGWLGALADPDIGRALALVHADPAHEWTVAGLARELALSRLDLRRPLHRAGRRAGHGVRDPLAHARRPRPPPGRRHHRRRRRRRDGLPLRGRVQPRLPPRRRHARRARCGRGLATRSSCSGRDPSSETVS